MEQIAATCHVTGMSQKSVSLRVQLNQTFLAQADFFLCCYFLSLHASSYPFSALLDYKWPSNGKQPSMPIYGCAVKHSILSKNKELQLARLISH